MTSLLGWLRRALGPKAPAALGPVLEIRRLYLEQVQATANLEAATAALDRQIREHRETVERWERRGGLPLSDELRADVVRIVTRYADHVSSALRVRADCTRALAVCHRVQESLLQDLTRLGSAAASVGLDTRHLVVEVDLGAVERSAEERAALALVEEGICETDEERAFAERLFDRGLEARVSRSLQ